MFFSRKQPNAHEIAAMQAAARAKLAPPPASAPPEKGNLEREFVDTQTLNINELISDMKGVPPGTYWRFEENGIPGMFAESFAVVRQGEEFSVLLIANDAFSTHPQFDLQRRLREVGLKKVGLYRASREIIKSIHSMQDATAPGKKDDSQSQRAAWEVIDSAAALGASDIHLQTRETHAQVFYRINGDRVEQPNISMETAIKICNVLYNVHGDADSKLVDWDPKKVRSTSIDRTTRDGLKIQIRFSSRPIHPSGNFKAVMRLLERDGQEGRTLEEMDYTAAIAQEMEEMLAGSDGAIFAVGPVGSGKSTLLQSMVRRIYEIRGSTISVDTLEQPVEYIMSDACQTAVAEGRDSAENAASEKTFASYLRGLLQQDPDVLVVGEIRSAEAAAAAMQAALGGRKLLTTVHATDPWTVFPRLRDLGVPPSVLYMPGFVAGIVSQRLVPELCPKCSIPLDKAHAEGRVRPALYDRVMRTADLQRHTIRTRSTNGCSHCKGTGIIGRTTCTSVIRPDETMLRMLAAGEESAARERWRNLTHLNVDGLGVTQVAHAISKMRQGRLDPADVERLVGLLVVDPPTAWTPARDHAPMHEAVDLPPALR